MSYTAPAGDALVFDFSTAPGYTAPGAGALVFDFSAGSTETPVGVGAVTLEFIPAGAGTVTLPTFTGTGAATLDFTPASQARHGVAGQGAVVLEFAPAGVAAHPRYQLRGQVQDGGTLVDRRVRAYKRSTGALIAQADTVAGLFALDVGFTLDEFYVVPVDLSNDAEDWTPPVANRVLSVLKVD